MEDITMIFKKRLKELRGTKNQAEVAKKIGISRSALSYYESGDRTPDINVLHAIADYYNVTSDYLLGFTDITHPDMELSAISRKTGLSKHAIETLETWAQKSEQALSDQESLFNFLKTQSINILIEGETNRVLDDITFFLFSNFTHFYNLDDNHEKPSPIEDLALCDNTLGLTVSYGSEYYIANYLKSIQTDLRTLRLEWNTIISKIIRNENGSIDDSTVREKLKIAFSESHVHVDKDLSGTKESRRNLLSSYAMLC